ncbi:MAG: hypothetical protein AAF969_01575 [Bacteroidota bacterium]
MVNNKWREFDQSLDLCGLFEHFGFAPVRKEKTYQSYKMGKEHAIVINTSLGQRYYLARRPERKLAAFDLVLDQFSKLEGPAKMGLWSKVDDFYGHIGAKGLFKLEPGSSLGMDAQAKDYNHFEDMASGLSFTEHIVENDPHGIFKGRVQLDAEGRKLFPFRNLANTLTGYAVEDRGEYSLLAESDVSASVWFSNIPSSIEHLVVFKSPMEAVAFHNRFQLKDTVYLSFLDINYDTAKILTQIHKTTKLNKFAISLTGKSKVEGYIHDLMLMSHINDSRFLVQVGKDHLGIRFHPGTEKALTSLYNEVKKFNNSLAQEYMGYNKIPDQSLLNQRSIILTRERDMVLCRLPFDVNALRYFLWSYYRNYMGKTIEIIKPVDVSWAKDYQENGMYHGSSAMEAFKMAV